MYSFANIEPVTSEQLWTRFSAAREIGTALEALEEAGAGLIRLLDDSDWESAGIRALHHLLGRLRDRTSAEVGGLHAREWELDGEGAR